MQNEPCFTPYTAKELSPEGWLRRQLELQAAGLGGHLDKVWPDVRDSAWIGGGREGWERVPYWLDGFIPLAWLLGDEGMKRRAERYVDAILERQQADGWLCPGEGRGRAGYDMWALFLVCKVLALYHGCAGDARMEDAACRALRSLDRHMEQYPLFGWAKARWFECLVPLFWLYERRPEPWLMGLCRKLEFQGTDYQALFAHWRYARPRGKWGYPNHAVNLAMMLKSRALMSRVTGEDPNAFAKKALTTLLRGHGQAAGHFSGDECLSGASPVQGAELCSVVEAMYSYEWLAAVTGDGEWCDRLEIAAYNALPAALSPDMWAHQYDQMTNQVQCSVIPEKHKPFRTNSGESHLFGLEPNYGCCTANFSQGWPKFALSALMAARDGVAVTAIAPCSLKARVAGVDVNVSVRTDYPFEDGYSVIVETPAPVEFTLYARIPGSAKAARVDGAPAGAGFYPVRRVWEGKRSLAVSMEFTPERKPRPSGMACVWRGPLLYALPIEEDWRRREYVRDGVERKFPYCDYEIFPMSKWNYGFASDQFSFERHGVGETPFQPERPPVSLTAELAEIEWECRHGVCAEKPSHLTPLGPAGRVRLIPYGCTNLRMAEMPAV
ncbi:MAG: glycoside hydrolase family 127 protein [Oscillospiraceae bacterium]|jgi:hypothetical protein|nr:glycoside hydrolase family 127 protein [Oscillospiraceae bacterium]